MNIKKKVENKHTIKLSIDDLMKLYESFPTNKKESEFQWAHRMGRNKLIIELVDKLVNKI
jgi:hypothetical protein